MAFDGSNAERGMLRRLWEVRPGIPGRKPESRAFWRVERTGEPRAACMKATMSAASVEDGKNAGRAALAKANVGGVEVKVDGVSVQRDLEPGRVPWSTGRLS
jgi:hypothetical protein